MSRSRSSVAVLISNIVLATLLLAGVITSIVLWLGGNWEKHAWGLTLALKIMWGVWVLLLVGTILTRVTVFGWHFRRMRPSEWPAALRKAVAEGVRPPSWYKSGATSFTISVVMVSLTGAAALAIVLLWIIGDWQTYGEPLWLAVRIIGGVWWVLVIATVLVRIAIFNRQRQLAAQARAARENAASPDSGARPSPSEGETGTSHEQSISGQSDRSESA